MCYRRAFDFLTSLVKQVVAVIFDRCCSKIGNLPSRRSFSCGSSAVWPVCSPAFQISSLCRLTFRRIRRILSAICRTLCESEFYPLFSRQATFSRLPIRVSVFDRHLDRPNCSLAVRCQSLNSNRRLSPRVRSVQLDTLPVCRAPFTTASAVEILLLLLNSSTYHPLNQDVLASIR